VKVFLGTSVIVDIDRGKKEVIDVCRKLTMRHEVAKAKKVLGQFSWINLNGTVAEKTAQLNAYLITEGQTIEYQDQAIAASCLATGSDGLLTRNKEHFTRIPALKDKVLTPEELKQKL
jgi:predicted nucleic acid-binding protein